MTKLLYNLIRFARCRNVVENKAQKSSICIYTQKIQHCGRKIYHFVPFYFASKNVIILFLSYYSSSKQLKLLVQTKKFRGNVSL